MGGSVTKTDLPRIQYLGTTWYDRGWRYRLRRFWLSFFSFLILLLACTVVKIFIEGMMSVPHSTWGPIVIAILCAIPIIWSCWSTYMRLRRTPEDRAAYRPMSFAPISRPTRAQGATGVAAGTLAAGGSSIAGAAVAFGTVFIIGQFIGWFFITLGRYTSQAEWEAARKYGVDDRLPKRRKAPPR